jgi:hypothetical protein
MAFFSVRQKQFFIDLRRTEFIPLHWSFSGKRNEFRSTEGRHAKLRSSPGTAIVPARRRPWRWSWPSGWPTQTAAESANIINDPPRCQTPVGQAFQPDCEPDKVRLESLTYLILWRVAEYYAMALGGRQRHASSSGKWPAGIR